MAKASTGNCQQLCDSSVGSRELRSLVQPHRDQVLGLRARYERGFRDIIEAGVRAGRFGVASARLASYAVLDLGMGVAAWYREDGEPTEDEVV
ncbi:Transcriptional regulator (fragment) [Frankia canadensis]|uniref:Transcriptional regulator n=1 Tax=Frankia canadensis TaxID=1836972 RepID=A0A2I2L058_9ACTN